MARYVGKNAAVYVARTAGGSASPVPFVTQITTSNKVNQIDGTAFQDTNTVKFSGFADASGTVAGYRDQGAKILLDNARLGFAAATYFYEDIVNAPTVYHFTTAIWDISDDVSENAMAKWTANWASATGYFDGPGVTA